MSQMLDTLHHNFDAALQAHRTLQDGLIEVVRRQGEIISEFLATSQNALQELKVNAFDQAAHQKHGATASKMIENWMAHAQELGTMMAGAQNKAAATLNEKLGRGETAGRRSPAPKN